MTSPNNNNDIKIYIDDVQKLIDGVRTITLAAIKTYVDQKVSEIKEKYCVDPDHLEKRCTTIEQDFKELFSNKHLEETKKIVLYNMSRDNIRDPGFVKHSTSFIFEAFRGLWKNRKYFLESSIKFMPNKMIKNTEFYGLNTDNIVMNYEVDKFLDGVENKILENLSIKSEEFTAEKVIKFLDSGTLFISFEAVTLESGSFSFAYILVDHFGKVKEQKCYWYEPFQPYAISQTGVDLEHYAQRFPIVKKEIMSVLKESQFNSFTEQIHGDNPIEIKEKFLEKLKELIFKHGSDNAVIADHPYILPAKAFKDIEFIVHPIIDFSTVLYCWGLNPLGCYEKEENEKPEGHPLAVATQMKRLFLLIKKGRTDEIKEIPAPTI